MKNKPYARVMKEADELSPAEVTRIRKWMKLHFIALVADGPESDDYEDFSKPGKEAQASKEVGKAIKEVTAIIKANFSA